MDKCGITILGRDPVFDLDYDEFAELCDKKGIFVDLRLDLNDKPLYKWRLKLVLKMIEDGQEGFTLDQDIVDDFMCWLMT